MWYSDTESLWPMQYRTALYETMSALVQKLLPSLVSVTDIGFSKCTLFSMLYSYL